MKKKTIHVPATLGHDLGAAPTDDQLEEAVRSTLLSFLHLPGPNYNHDKMEAIDRILELTSRAARYKSASSGK